MKHPFKHRIAAIGLLWLMTAAVLAGMLGTAVPPVQAEGEGGKGSAVVIPIKGTVDPVMKSFLFRALEEAEQLQPEAVIFDMDTPGGYVDVSMELSQRIIGSPARTVVLVHGKAASAGSFLALSANEIAMTPGSAIGSAALVDSSHNYVDDPKAVALWVSQMVSAAEKNGRDADIAAAMADLQAKVEVQQLNRTKQPGEVLSLSVQEAKRVGYLEYEASSVQDLLTQMKLDGAQIVHIEPSAAERIASYVVTPVVATLLLFLGIAGVAIELIVPGFGVPGILGILGFGLYFFGHFIAGLAGVETIVLLLIGLVLLALEMFIPSFGILGILGAISLISGVVRAAYDTGNALMSLGIAFVAAVIVVVVIARIFKHRGIWNRFILKDALTTEQGFVSAADHTELIGKVGKALTPLRPAGTILLEGHKYDVVTDGAFIAKDEQVVVVMTEGARIVVSPHEGS